VELPAQPTVPVGDTGLWNPTQSSPGAVSVQETTPTAPTTSSAATSSATSLLQDWLAAEPTAAYGAWNQQLGGTPAMNRYYKNNYGNMYQNYMGALGTQAQQGTMPTQSFGQYLQGYDAQKNYQNLPSYQRGYSPRTFSPSRRWINY